jgi:hypothetical protein
MNKPKTTRREASVPLGAEGWGYEKWVERERLSSAWDLLKGEWDEQILQKD